MSDTRSQSSASIVERLRRADAIASLNLPPLCIEAADEIERLRADNRAFENEIRDAALGPTMVQNMRGELERLRAASADLATENERLRAELALYKQNYARKQLTDSERRALEGK